MKPLVLAAPAPADTATRLRFDALSPADAERLDGTLVGAQFVVGAPPFTWDRGAEQITVVAPADGPDPNVTRTVVLRGDRLDDADLGARVALWGVLRVVRHPAATVGGVRIAAWTEIRIEEIGP